MKKFHVLFLIAAAIIISYFSRAKYIFAFVPGKDAIESRKTAFCRKINLYVFIKICIGVRHFCSQSCDG